MKRAGLLVVAVTLVVAGIAACDESSESPEAEAESSRGLDQPGSEGGEHANDREDRAEEDHEGEQHGEEEGHHDHAIRLGVKMQHISHRMAAAWYAGRAGNVEFLDYQLHELEETVEEIKEAGVEEHGLDVGDQLEGRILSQTEGLEEAAAEGNTEAFEKKYRGIVEQCNSCHADAEYGFIRIEEPTRNPYPNVDLSGGGSGE